MKKVINQLIQLQELIEARAQQEALATQERLVPLEEAIQTMLRQLPPDVAAHFMRIVKRWRVGVVPMSNSVCAGCGMTVPVSQFHAIRAAQALHQCPHCGRFIYAPEVNAPRRMAVNRAGVAPKVGIARFSSVELMIPALVATERDSAIAELCQCMESAGFVDSGARLAEEALKREAIVSTALGNGVAFPHVRGVEGGGLTLAVGISPQGVRFGADKKELTHILCFMAIPTAASAFYLKLLAGLTRVFTDEASSKKLMAAKTSADLWKALVQVTRKAIP